MILVTVELVPKGDFDRRKIIAQAKIANDGTGTNARGNYRFVLWRKKPTAWRSGEVTNFPRTRFNVWYLIRRCLENL